MAGGLWRSLALAYIAFAVYIFAYLYREKPMPFHLEEEANTQKQLSIVVPAYKEQPNIRPLTEQVFAAVRKAGIDAELIIVDDNSKDGSLEEVENLQKEGYPVKILVREKEKGLSTAVLAGFEAAKNEVLLVMDADLQHPPEYIPSLVDPLFNHSAHFTLGSRYIPGGGTKDWALIRQIISHGATLLAKPLVPVNDPMSGFFSIRKSLFKTAENLNPRGFKIALELMVKCAPHRVLEVPFTFVHRTHGESKLKISTQVQYLVHLAALYWHRHAAVVVMAGTLGLATLGVAAVSLRDRARRNQKQKQQ